MECTSAKQGDAIVLKIEGRLDSNTSPRLEQECLKWIDEGETFLVMDFADLEYISSAGLRTILSAVKKLKARQGKFALCNVRTMVREVFTISGFDSFITICANLDDALAI